MKKTIGFRLSEDILACLGDLARAWDCTRTEVIERLIEQHKVISRKLGEERTSPPPRQAVKDRPLSDFTDEEIVTAQSVAAEINAAPKLLTRAEREAKIEAAQRRMAQSARKR
jgi:predicted transcriptional regulator